MPINIGVSSLLVRAVSNHPHMAVDVCSCFLIVILVNAEAFSVERPLGKLNESSSFLAL